MQAATSLSWRISIYRKKILGILVCESTETDPLRDYCAHNEILYVEQPTTVVWRDLSEYKVAKPRLAPRVFDAMIAKLRFMTSYLIITTAVFVVLMVISNVQAYSSILYAYLDPGAISKQGDVLRSITDLSITDDTGTIHDDSTASLSDVKKELEGLNVDVRDNPLSPETLKNNTLTLRRTIDMTPYENRLIIPKIAKNAPIVDIDAWEGFDFDHMENIFMKELEKGVVRYPGTAAPGEYGNMFVFGHSSNYVWSKGDFNQIFALLPKLEKGDDIIIYYNQKKYTYIVRDKKVVSPGDVKAIKNDKTKKELNLMTCYPVGTTLSRMIIFADLKE